MASDPFDQRYKMANMRISDESPSMQTKQQPPYYMQGSNPATAATTAPAAYPPNTAGFAAPAGGQSPTRPAPVPVSPMQTPLSTTQPQVSPMQVSPMQQSTPSPMQAQQKPQTYPPPLQAQQPQPQCFSQPTYATNQMYTTSSAPVFPSQASPPQAPPSQGTTTTPTSYDPFAPAPVAQVEPNPVAAPTETTPFNPPPQSVTPPPPAAEDTHANQIDVTDEEADFWAQMGFAVQETPAATADDSPTATAMPPKPGMMSRNKSLRASIVRTLPKSPTIAQNEKKEKIKDSKDENAVDKNGLLASGKYYKVTLGKGNLGTTFVTTEETGVNLFYSSPESFIKTLKNRPVVGYTSTNSVVDKAGVSVGDVLLQVHDKPVDDPESAMYAIRDECDKKCGCRGLVLHMWKPPHSIHVTHAENQCVVEYHHKSVEVPKTNSDWKSKYVVVGGIAAEPWEIKMYYNKNDYDKAVTDKNENKYKASVKVKSFSLIGARLITATPRTIHYMLPGQQGRRPWYYFVVKTKDGKAIKIGHPLMKGLEPVFEGVNKAIEYAATYKPF